MYVKVQYSISSNDDDLPNLTYEILEILRQTWRTFCGHTQKNPCLYKEFAYIRKKSNIGLLVHNVCDR